MRVHSTLQTACLAALLSYPTSASITKFQQAELKNLIVKRSYEKFYARANATDGQTSYAPATNQSCPFPSDHDYIRPATSLSTNETTYIEGRLNNAKDSLKTFFTNANFTLDNLDDLLSNTNTVPRVAIAISGGGYRAMLHGSGGISALDSRNDSSVAGLLQSSIYMAGLSGGSWAVTSFAASDMASPYYLESNVWNMEDSLVAPSGIVNAAEYYSDVVADVLDKIHAGFDTSITDLWARALSYHLFDSNVYPDHAATTTFGGAIRNTSTFRAQQMPYPIIVALEREPGQLIVGQNASIFTFDPYEFGSFEPLGGNGLGATTGAFVPIDQVGTKFNDGKVAENQCVSGFDNIGFTVATSATIFNEALIELTDDGSTSGVIQSALKDAIEEILGSLSASNNDIAPYPNPWYGYLPQQNDIAGNQSISLVDGGEALDNIPLWPLLNPDRQVDFVMAYDSSADTDYSYPNGTAMIATWNRTMYNSQKYSMPNVPTNSNSWVNLGLNSRPTFFGCNASDVTNYNASANWTAPIIAYIPSWPWSYFANTSTYKLSYEHSESLGALNNAFHSTTLNDTVSDWPKCLACAVVKRSVERSGLSHSDQCQECYNTWCWNGTTNDTQPSTYEPFLGSLPKFVADITNQSQYTRKSG
ncbi:hypothetical protein PUNSTDRAFT_144669 [Punctularia strigosozonata HHB-11173 SS5]|uniref:uncharacterized protein n=1 Tax=Punctularia strigosozonata (strain HHB-11173) TaxID=741275 RepID=UPI000441663D|nr:uncharacterized protein PUNSTDRAFT_144669 [Punctularia strigosozonata HHB-11173 SS5]EIN07115.1 hypothetical protein PUNSTDRAFT_144669 [Punctularia strigosozonata HHB-11173 SS5]